MDIRNRVIVEIATAMMRYLQNSGSVVAQLRCCVAGITFPSGEQQQLLLEEVYSECGVRPSEVAYVEAHGTGTKVGDPQEVNSIARVFCTKSRKRPLIIGSTKSNMGHPEPASGEQC